MLKLAESDLKALQGMMHPSLFDHGFFSDSIFGFHAQQVAEKSLKALIAASGRMYPRTHDLMALIELLAPEQAHREGLADLVDLNAFAVEYRYAVVEPDETPIDRDKIFMRVLVLYDSVRLLIHHEQHG